MWSFNALKNDHFSQLPELNPPTRHHRAPQTPNNSTWQCWERLKRQICRSRNRSRDLRPSPPEQPIATSQRQITRGPGRRSADTLLRSDASIDKWLGTDRRKFALMDRSPLNQSSLWDDVQWRPFTVSVWGSPNKLTSRCLLGTNYTPDWITEFPERGAGGLSCIHKRQLNHLLLH